MSASSKLTVNNLIVHAMITIMLLVTVGVIGTLNCDQVHALSKIIKITASDLNVRSDAGTEYDVIDRIDEGKYKRVLKTKTDSQSYKWYKIKVGNKYGYVRSDFVKVIKFTIKKQTNKKAKVDVSSGNLTIRKGPGKIFKKAGSIPKGKTYKVNARAKDIYGEYWYRIKVDGKNVYAKGQYLKITKTTTTTSTSSEATSSSSTSASTTKSSSTSAASTDTIKVGIVSTSSSSLNVRTGAGTGYSRLGTLGNGTYITIIGSATSTKGELWYKYQYSTKQAGYVCGKYITVKKITKDKTFEDYMTQQKFPNSYKAGLRVLHAAHPNWKFKAVNIDSTWSDALYAETKNVGRNLVAPTLPTSYRSKEKGAYNSKTGSWTRFDGRWYAASKQVVAYYMDPRNFLNENGVYQFMTHQYDSDSQSTKTVKAVVKGTFMENRSPNSKTYSSYASLINSAGKNSGVNPNVIAAMIVQEQGVNGTSGLISGTYSGYKGYYNFFNIGAYTTSSMSAVQRGLWYAKQSGSYCRPWNTVYKSIKGGAIFYGNNYVYNNQDTYYYKKFNVKNGADKIGTHQYMTNVSAAASEGNLLKKAFSENTSYAAVIEVPIYEDMPSDACPLP